MRGLICELQSPGIPYGSAGQPPTASRKGCISGFLNMFGNRIDQMNRVS
jgi:hypothetical protein